jgi:uncharacterized protein
VSGKPILVFFGLVSVFLGILGVLLPVIPGTPFLLTGLVILVKTSDRVNRWVHNHSYWGPRVREYRRNPGMTRKEKLVMLGLMAVSVTSSYLVSGPGPLSFGVTAGASLFAVILLFFIPTARPGDGDDEESRTV